MPVVMDAVVKEKIVVTPQLALFTLSVPEVPKFEPGQFMMVGTTVEGKYMKRAYSVVSSPTQKELQFCVKAYEQGKVAKHILAVPVGGKLRVEGPYGKFIMNGTNKDKLLIAAGTGIAPMMSMLRTLHEKGFPGKAKLLFGTSFIETLVYDKELHEYAKHANFSYIPTLSREDADWKGENGRVEAVVQKHVTSAENWEAYVCGPPPMVENVKAYLLSIGFAKENVHIEQYW